MVFAPGDTVYLRPQYVGRYGERMQARKPYRVHMVVGSRFVCIHLGITNGVDSYVTDYSYCFFKITPVLTLDAAED